MVIEVTAVLGIQVDDIIACSLSDDDGGLKAVDGSFFHGAAHRKRMILFLLGDGLCNMMMVA